MNLGWEGRARSPARGIHLGRAWSHHIALLRQADSHVPGHRCPPGRTCHGQRLGPHPLCLPGRAWRLAPPPLPCPVSSGDIWCFGLEHWTSLESRRHLWGSGPLLCGCFRGSGGSPGRVSYVHGHGPRSRLSGSPYLEMVGGRTRHGSPGGLHWRALRKRWKALHCSRDVSGAREQPSPPAGWGACPQATGCAVVTHFSQLKQEAPLLPSTRRHGRSVRPALRGAAWRARQTQEGCGRRDGPGALLGLVLFSRGGNFTFYV